MSNTDLKFLIVDDFSTMRRIVRGLLKEMGCNAIRLSHNPVTPFLLDECDRMGFLVMAENRNMGDVYVDQTPKDAPAVEHRELSALVKRDTTPRPRPDSLP